ncbi:MAG: hypothetical protein AB7D07_00035 [Desulfovibrionaceae bacterium]
MSVRLSEVAGALALLLFNGLGMWIVRGWFARMTTDMERLESKIDGVLARHSDCRENLPAIYATRDELKEAVGEAHRKLGELDRSTDEHAERIAKLEVRSGKAA